MLSWPTADQLRSDIQLVVDALFAPKILYPRTEVAEPILVTRRQLTHTTSQLIVQLKKQIIDHLNVKFKRYRNVKLLSQFLNASCSKWRCSTYARIMTFPTCRKQHCEVLVWRIFTSRCPSASNLYY